MEPPARRGTKIRRGMLTATAVLAVCAAGGTGERSGVRTPGHPAAVRRCGGRVGPVPPAPLPLPPEAVARAADQARIQAPFLYRGSGPAVVVRSALAPYAGPRGDEVTVQCGTRVSRRTVVVDLLFPKMLPSASLSQGTVFVSLSGTGYRVWQVAH
jgi:hypothetical protein